MQESTTLAGHLFVVLPGLGGALDCVVGHRHLASRPGRPVNLHLHAADALADPHGFTLERENTSVVVIIDGHRGGWSAAQGCLGRNMGDAHRAVAGGNGAWLQDGDLSPVSDAWITQAHVEVLILLENIIINNADVFESASHLPSGLFLFNLLGTHPSTFLHSLQHSIQSLFRMGKKRKVTTASQTSTSPGETTERMMYSQM
ncbi:hypothetical protein EYF80_007020 [Liparis tanakae]|uniref:Uncharacterized protein n=1 Tax=Liparis tanakae TaxID=230148 RepID=A0A4Z2IXR4_9TELE|nr:hypothetical protein EYF80_007020 [Liparis tanakae]